MRCTGTDRQRDLGIAGRVLAAVQQLERIVASRNVGVEAGLAILAATETVTPAIVRAMSRSVGWSPAFPEVDSHRAHRRARTTQRRKP